MALWKERESKEDNKFNLRNNIWRRWEKDRKCWGW